MKEEFSKYVFGYEVNVEKQDGKDTYIAKINELGIEGKAQNKGRAIRQVFDKISNNLRQGRLDLSKFNSKQYDTTFENRILKVNQKITNFGFCVIAEDINTSDLGKLEKVCDNIDLNNNHSIEEIEYIESEIANAIKNSLFSAKKRAFNMTFLIMKTSHINKFSHLIEQAYISFFREEYISTIMTLVPVIEGILLSVYGFDSNEKNKPKVEKLLNTWAELQYVCSTNKKHNPIMIDEYIRAFIEICQQTVFSAHESSEKNLYFNRHYIAHLMGCGKFYSRNNAFKFIILVDLLAYVLDACNNQNNDINMNDEKYIVRTNYYQSLYEYNHEDKLKHELLNEHTNFKGYG
ncbi:MAG: hypothetical protein ACRDA3_10585 [Peptostreptococcaceae bacterium]